MHDAVEMAGIEDLFQLRAVGDIALDELGAGRNQIAPGVAEIVVNDDLMARVDQAHLQSFRQYNQHLR